MSCISDDIGANVESWYIAIERVSDTRPSSNLTSLLSYLVNAWEVFTCNNLPLGSWREVESRDWDDCTSMYERQERQERQEIRYTSLGMEWANWFRISKTWSESGNDQSLWIFMVGVSDILTTVSFLSPYPKISTWMVFFHNAGLHIEALEPSESSDSWSRVCKSLDELHVERNGIRVGVTALFIEIGIFKYRDLCVWNRWGLEALIFSVYMKVRATD